MPSNKSVGGSSDHHRRPPSKEGDSYEASSSVLWVGNIPADTVDSVVMDVFSKFGALDCNTMHGARSYSFVFFRSIDDAKAAKDALQGSPLHGSSIKIEFARPAKAAKHLWIGGISSSVTKEQLEDEFLKFGKIEEHRFLRDRNSALIDYHKTEDAIAAQKNMNGKRLGGEQLRVDFQRSQPPRKDWPDQRDSRNGQFGSRGLGLQERLLPPDGRGFHDSSYHGPKRHMPYGGRRDGYPTNVLWIGYPPSVQIDEQKLHNAMILFGEIERIKCFPSRNYSFVEFRSIDEARRAKEGLQGRLFNDPRIQILFSSSDLAPGKDDTPPFPGFRGPRPEMFFAEGPIGPLELYGPGRAIAPNSFPGALLPNSMPGPGILMRPFGPQGFDPCHGSPEFHDFGGTTMPSNWGWRSPLAPGILPSPPSMRPPFRPVPGLWDEFDIREPKKLRMDGSSTDSAFFHATRLDSGGFGDPSGFSQPDRGASGQNCPSPVVRGYGELHPSPDSDHCWRGILAKGGTPVCHARCVPVGKGIDSPFPEVVNCSARTGLDMLTKHYADAIGFDIVFFLPDSEDDFVFYTEFLHYLGLKNRAGVAKLDDGTTLFLVPPSDFLTKVLNFSGPERLYGVVLKLPQQSTNAAVQQPQLATPLLPSHYIDQQEASNSQKGYQSVPQNGDQALKVDYNRSVYGEPMHHSGVGKSLLMLADEPSTAQSASLDDAGNSTAVSQVGVSLTPELISTLASLIPRNNQSSAAGTVQMPSGSTNGPAASSASAIHAASMPFEGWRQDQAVVSNAPLEQTSYLPQHLGQQFNSQAPLSSHFPTYANIPSGPDHSAEPIVGSTQAQNPALNMPEAPSILTRPSYNYSIPFQGGQFPGSFTSHSNYGMLQTTNPAGVFNQAVQQQLKPPSSSTHDQIGNLPQPQIAMPPTQGHQPQTVLSGSSTSGSDADKNQRYQSTLQFAASLLLQLQQQQQASAQAVQEPGNQH
ncbi:flowering time control protein FPA-like [Phoenix dactylifera]|uniref:Flowering time control protein FPA-like n=1 Tax=Phoenix dactylifera TaxID=42345 RepID=A0A8B7C2Y8_PHODC|nr:flowering time control protein FPA-like [Phoenix dactylifera]XP_026660689.2 flowering time control protein FPA-like [Phoenix dactylifera]XP_038984154.1 flowering time control protein FPA-like [Phoenix dactylifera]